MINSYAYASGFMTGAGLIIAIGAQNAFVLTQGIHKNHALAVAGLCALLDALLIGAGVLGVGTLVRQNVYVHTIASLGGATFLLWFGVRSLVQAKNPKALLAGENSRTRLGPTLAATLAVSLLNPHVYLDTVIMLGAISASYPGHERYLFGAGAATASVIWFFSLSLAGSALAPVFRKPAAWRLLHLCVTFMVWWVALGLVRGWLGGSL